MMLTRAWGVLRCIDVPGKAGCVVLWGMLIPSQLGWLLEMASEGMK